MRGWCACILLTILLTGCVSERLLSRKKRYLVFPDGSSFVLTMSNPRVLIPYKPPLKWQGLIECDVSFKLPSNTTRWPSKRKPGSNYVHRRDRRELYQQLETLLDTQGLNGAACVKRALCEASNMPSFENSSLVQDFLRLIFTIRLQVLTVRNKGHVTTGRHRTCCRVPPGNEGDLQPDVAQYESAADMSECSSWRDHCPFSLLDFQLADIWD